MRLTHMRRFGLFLPIAACALFPLLVVSSGCSSSEEAFDTWETPSATPASARADYRVDSLISENRRLKQQLEAMAIENRKITARNAELEMKMNEAKTAAPVQPVSPPISVAPEVSTSPPAPAERRAPAERTTPAVRTSPAPKSPAPKKAPASDDLFARYSDAMQVYRNRDFSSAITQFEGLLKAGISQDLADNCHYWIGQSHYDLKQYDSAIPHFETILRTRASDKKADAQLMIANCFLEMGNTEAARTAYQKVISDYPTSPYKKKAEERLSRLR